MKKEKTKEKKKETEPISKTIKANALMVKKIFKHSPALVLLLVFGGIVGGVTSSMRVIFTAKVFEYLGQGRPFEDYLPVFLLGASAVVLYWLYGRLNYLYFRPWMQNRLHYRMHEEIFKKSLEADLSCFDDPEFYNDFVWAMDESDARSMKVLDSIAQFINFAISLGTTFAIMFAVSPIVVLIMFVRSVFTFLFEKKVNKLYVKQDEETKPITRKIGYIGRVFHLGEYAKELRTSFLSETFIRDYDRCEDDLLDIRLRYNRKHFLISVLRNLMELLPASASLIIVTVGLYNGTVDFAGFVIVVTYMWRIMYLFQNFGYYLNGFRQHGRYIEKYMKFMAFSPKVVTGSKEVPDFETIELRNVSFRYKEEDDAPWVLRGVNLTLHKGEKIALVGYNGAGKTTLIKLLLRFYDPTEGEILLNGVDIKEYDLRAYRERIGAVFQDFKLFSASIAENVLGHPVRDESDKAAVLKALERASFPLDEERFPKGTDTMLTREFDDDGTDLSGGEAQKVAIARTFSRHYDLVVMDEPSASLDPVAEYELNHSVAENLKGQTVVFISHRLSTTRMTDVIYMFDSGEIIERGSHDELMKQNGKYAEMFELQSKKYRHSTAGA